MGGASFQVGWWFVRSFVRSLVRSLFRRLLEIAVRLFALPSTSRRLMISLVCLETHGRRKSRCSFVARRSSLARFVFVFVHLRFGQH